MAALSRTVNLSSGGGAAQAGGPLTAAEVRALEPAMAAMAERNYDKAIVLLTSALGRDPGNAAIRVALVTARSARELQRESTAAGQRAGIRGGGQTDETRARLDDAGRAIAQGNWRAALDAYARARWDDRQDRGISNALSLLNAEPPREGLALYAEATRAIGEENYRGAVEALLEAVRQYPGDQGLRSALNIAQGFYQQAIDEEQSVGVVPSPVTNASRTEFILGASRDDPHAQAALEFMRQGD